MFGHTQIDVSDKITFHFLNIGDYSPALKEKINEEVGRIWNGDLEEDVDMTVVKAELKELIEPKDDAKKHGIVAEFICHLFLRSLEYEQHFLFQNLEEKGMKKGFDGLYIKDSVFWLYESKSTLPTTIDSDHNKNIGKAYNGLKHKIEGTESAEHPNNPWKNAYHHAQNRAISENQTISQILKKFSDDFVKKKYQKVSEFNLIPSSTIYLDDRWCHINCDDLRARLEGLIENYECKTLHLICINKKSIADFLSYVDE
jgi:hypothetical protein